VPCEVERAQIKQVAENILINAKEAMPNGGMWNSFAENYNYGTIIRSLGQGNYAAHSCNQG